MDKFRNKYRISSTRLQKWDYGWNASYFITICTKNREYFFGEIVKTPNPGIATIAMQLTEIGYIAHKFWDEIPNHFPFVQLGAFVVMPNHVHGIIIIDKQDDQRNVIKNIATNVGTRHCLVSTPGQKRFQNQGKNTLSSIVGSYKSVVTKHARKIHADFAWQSRFHDHIIRDDESYQRIRNYIINNPQNWKNDKFFW